MFYCLLTGIKESGEFLFCIGILPPREDVFSRSSKLPIDKVGKCAYNSNQPMQLVIHGKEGGEMINVFEALVRANFRFGRMCCCL